MNTAAGCSVHHVTSSCAGLKRTNCSSTTVLQYHGYSFEEGCGGSMIAVGFAMVQQDQDAHAVVQWHLQCTVH